MPVQPERLRGHPHHLGTRVQQDQRVPLPPRLVPDTLTTRHRFYQPAKLSPPWKPHAPAGLERPADQLLTLVEGTRCSPICRASTGAPRSRC
jgi:hypothetical protein